MKKQRVQLELVKTIYIENSNKKETYVTKIYNEKGIEKIWNLARKYSLLESIKEG